MEYSYADGDIYYFMDSESYELIPIDKSILSDSFRFVKENMVCAVASYKGNVFSVEAPKLVELEVTDTDPGLPETPPPTHQTRTLETGAEIKVPLFIEPGERIKIDTRSGEYLERAKG
jgi:elongation factor P